MKCRQLASKTYGDFGKFPRVENTWYRSPSGRIHLLGNGHVGGKTEGLMFLDQSSAHLEGYQIPKRTLVICNDFFGIDHRSAENPSPVTELSQERLATLFDVLEKMQFSSAVAIRSSALVEDQIGRTGAGRFQTDFFAGSLTTTGAKSAFAQRLLGVINSSYSSKGLDHWTNCGYSDIPPLAVIIQEVVGNR